SEASAKPEANFFAQRSLSEHSANKGREIRVLSEPEANLQRTSSLSEAAANTQRTKAGSSGHSAKLQRASSEQHQKKCSLQRTPSEQMMSHKLIHVSANLLY
ncbi:hypothetical protein L195_g061372, partial [Trifolium pratense]